MSGIVEEDLSGDVAGWMSEFRRKKIYRDGEK